ncbi:MAG: ABC transporter permease, partial [Gemmatimonadaceae bacterium]
MRDDCLAIDRATRKRARWRNGLDELQRDATFAARAVRRDLSFAILTIVILALGIGATTALFSLYNGVVMRPLAVANPERVMWMTMYDGEGSDGVSPAAYFAWRDRSRTIARLTTVREATGTLVGSGEPVRLEGLRVGESFFETLGIRPTAGRALTARDNAPGADPVVVLGNAISSARFGGDSATVGRAISIDGVNRTVVGVLPPSIDVFGGKVEFVVPDALGEGLRTNWTPFLQAIALLNSGTSAAAAERELSAIATSKWKETRAEPLPPAAGVRVQSLGDHLTAPFRDRIALLFAGVICVLVIGCVNVANLLWARGAVRGREMSLLASLGASRGRPIRQLETENGMLDLIGGVAGVALATWMVRAIVLILPRDLPRLSEVRLDGTSTLFALSLTLITLLISGVVPALRAAEGDLRGALQGGGRGATAGSATDTLRSVFVVAQIAMTTVLLVVAGLLVRSAGALGAVSPGFSPDSVLTARYALSEREYNSAERVLGAHERILTSLQQSFGDHVALASSIPLGGGSGGSDFLLLGGGSSTRKEVNAGLRFVTPGYLRTMGITLLAGRDFDGRDTRVAERAIIISESLARALGLAVSPSTLGRSLGGTSSPFKDSTGTPFPWTVVGIVREPRDGGLRKPGDHQVFLPLAQTPAEVFDWSAREVHVVVRGGTAPERAAGDVAEAVHRVDAKLALYDVQTMRSRLRASLALDEANTALLSALGVAA